MSIRLILGPMFASKSTELIKIANRYKSIGKNILVINHFFNNRYNTNTISTHDKRSFDDCIILEKLYDMINKYHDIFIKSDIILIEEIQFFEDAHNFVVECADKYNKDVIAVGLVATYERTPFDNISKLIPQAEEITKLSALCMQCADGTLGNFTRRKVKEGDMIGGKDKYETVCRKHYNNPI